MVSAAREWWKGRLLSEEKSDKTGRCRHVECHKRIKVGQNCVVIRKKKDQKLVARFCSHDCHNAHTLAYQEVREAMEL